MDKEKQVIEMAKILCPKGTANCEKCSKNYKCNVNFSQLSQLFDGGCRIVGEDEIVIKKSEYEFELTKAKNAGFLGGINVGKQETKEILQELSFLIEVNSFWDEFNSFWLKATGNKLGLIKADDITGFIRNEATKYGIELE